MKLQKICLILKKPIVIPLCHLLLLSICYCILFKYGWIKIAPSDTNLNNWDAQWYYSIMENGYSYIPGHTCNMAFFPLFPLFWELLSLSSTGISIVNALIFAFSYAFLVSRLGLNYRYSLVLISIPSFIFFGLPYSESLFFLFAAILIIGYRTNSKAFLIIGFLGTSLIRSAAMIAIPAIIITEIFSCDSGKTLSKKVSNALICIVPSFCGLMLSAILQASHTGMWFYFIEIQKYWKRHWLVPKFPLTTYSPSRILAIDGIAFVIGLLSIYFCFKWSYESLKKSREQRTFAVSTISRYVFFSVLYLAAVTVLDTFFTFDRNGYTSIWSINRHLLCTPFFLVFVTWLFKEFEPGKIDKMVIIGVIISGIYFTGVYQYVGMVTYYILFFTSFVLLRSKSKMVLCVAFFYLLNFAIQLQFFQDFLMGRWIA
ncbi:hypothetical protein SAMN05421820_114101 [Pedobacter steynii]|uniref:Mannosyltransferase (PIG-V) n=1 Tax=Pedobacter steynii TaxID=430522 RepID=A0A1H0J7B2_9SPHI|nr:hypothetical protein SAMN05421820_114101 [Pedobacter steynii]